MVLCLLPVIIGQPDQVGGHIFHRPRLLCQHADTGVHRRLCLHACAHHRSLRGQKRNCLTLHVGSHQRTICVIVLQEGNQRGSHGKHHPRRYVHVVKHGPGILRSLILVTARNGIADKMPFRIQGLTGLSHMVIILFVRRHVYHFVGNHRVVPVCFINFAVRCLYKTVFINPGIACQRVDQTNVGAFRRLNRTHSSIVGIVHVSDLKSCPISGKAAGAQGRKTPFMSQLAQRVILIHKLGKLRGTKKFLYGCRHRLDIDQGLG